MKTVYTTQSSDKFPLSPLHQEAVKEQFAELEAAAKPLVDYLYKHGDPYTTVAVTMDSIRVSQDTMGIPLEVRD